MKFLNKVWGANFSALEILNLIDEISQQKYGVPTSNPVFQIGRNYYNMPRKSTQQSKHEHEDNSDSEHEDDNIAAKAVEESI